MTSLGFQVARNGYLYGQPGAEATQTQEPQINSILKRVIDSF